MMIFPGRRRVDSPPDEEVEEEDGGDAVVEDTTEFLLGSAVPLFATLLTTAIPLTALPPENPFVEEET